jgi:hypothetical protein
VRPECISTPIEADFHLIDRIFSFSPSRKLISAVAGMMDANSLIVDVWFPIVDSIHDLSPLEQAVFSMVNVCEDLHIFAVPK